MDPAKNKLSLEDHQSSSRKKRKIALIISLIIIFTIIIGSILSALTILKHNAESESLLSVVTPAKAIGAVCSLTPSPRSCSTSLLGLQSSKTNGSTSAESKITPSQILALSLHVSYNDLTILSSTSQMVIPKVNASSRTFSALQECQSLTTDSLRLINQSVIGIGGVPEEEIVKGQEGVGNLKEWVKIAKENLDKCLNGLNDNNKSVIYGNVFLTTLKWEIEFSRQYVENSYVILEKMATIVDMFYNPIPLQSVLANILLSQTGFDFAVMFFSSQYLVIVFLLCLLLRL